MKNILILNGAPKRNDNTVALIGAFTEGAESAGHRVREFYLNAMDIRGCLDCQGCREARTGNPCVQRDDMAEAYEALRRVGRACPCVPGLLLDLRRAAQGGDRPPLRLCFLAKRGKKETVLLLSAGDGEERQFAQIAAWHENFERYLDWKNRGEVFAVGKVGETGKAAVGARELGGRL